MDQFNTIVGIINGYLWHDYVLFTVLGAGILFTLWSGFSQFRALTHGARVITGKYRQPKAPGALTHFQALSAALSATVGLGNIGGVAIAVALGGPGAVFWMWVVGFLGMALKSTEVILAMLYRNVENHDKPHGGAMWVTRNAGIEKGGIWAPIGKMVGGLFCLTVLTFAITGGNMFQAWNVADISQTYFDIPRLVTGVILAVVVGAVIIGGIKRIGTVAGTIVPFMCGLYVAAGLYVLVLNADQLPGLIKLIFNSAFNPLEAQGAFIGGTMGYAFLWGMKRALFSSEAGLGSAPMAHAAVKTKEPVREGVVAGLEPFIDTIVVCTITALVILSTGLWNRSADVEFSVRQAKVVEVADGKYTVSTTALPNGHSFTDGDSVSMQLRGEERKDTGNNITLINGTVFVQENGDAEITWKPIESGVKPKLQDRGVYADYVAATLTAKAFDAAQPGLGKWLVTLAVWLFAISTMISWSYYGEQGMIYMLGEKSVMPYRIIYCLLAVIACTGFITSTKELGNFSDLGAGFMLVVNIPITLILGAKAMKAYRGYIGRLKSGAFD